MHEQPHYTFDMKAAFRFTAAWPWLKSQRLSTHELFLQGTWGWEIDGLRRRAARQKEMQKVVSEAMVICRALGHLSEHLQSPRAKSCPYWSKWKICRWPRNGQNFVRVLPGCVAQRRRVCRLPRDKALSHHGCLAGASPPGAARRG